jgi:predicted membrane-bound spermidine synthase
MYNFIFLYYGFLAILTQLVLFRELLVLFYGSELFLGTFLSSWLFWAGLGSLLIWRLLKKERPAVKYFSYGFLAISLLFPAIILLIRVSKSAFAFGEFIGPLGTVLYTFSVMSALCFVIGGQFSLACAVASDKTGREVVLGRVYLCEALGAVIGGVIFTYLLIGFVPTFIIALVLSLGCIFVSLSLLSKKISLASILLIAAASAILFVNFRAEQAINRIEWKRYQFIKQKEARNATLSLLNLGSIKNIFIDGMLAASFPNPEGYEPAAHWPLLATADPSQILIIGDESLGVLKEALKHSPKQIDYVVSDNSFVNLAASYLEKEDISVLKDPVIHIYYADSRIFIRNNENKYDVVIINIPEVPNLKTNRFYTEEFYNQLRHILKPNGILGLSVASSENYLSMPTRIFNASVYDTLKSVFKAVEVISGDSLMFLASPSQIDMQKETLLGRFDKRNISNHYVIPSYIEYKLQAKRRAEFKKLLEKTPGVEINRDFRPSTCYYFANFWLNKFSSPSSYLAMVILFLSIVFGIIKKRKMLFSFAEKKECILIFSLGFISILLELILLFAYQIISGYVYWQMGILFASFMAGLFLGSLLANQFKNKSRQKYFIALVILCLIIIGLSLSVAHLLPYFIYLTTLQNIFIFTALLVLIGIIVGAAFVSAGFLLSENEITVDAGSLYAADLWGAGLGAILTANFIAPFFGILGALNFSAVIGSAGLAIFLILSRKTSLR